MPVSRLWLRCPLIPQEFQGTIFYISCAVLKLCDTPDRLVVGSEADKNSVAQFITIRAFSLCQYWTNNAPILAVARNLCGGGGGGKPEARRWRQSLGGCGGMLTQKILKFRSPEMPFPEAISSSYLIQVIWFFNGNHTTPYLNSQNVQICILVSIILQWWFCDWGGNCPPPPPASYGHAYELIWISLPKIRVRPRYSYG